MDLRNSIAGVMMLPFSSTAFLMLNTVRIVAIAIQTVSRAIFLPEQDLIEEEEISVDFTPAMVPTYRLP